MCFLNVSEYVNLAKLEDQLKYNNRDDIQSEVTLFILNYNSDLTFHKKTLITWVKFVKVFLIHFENCKFD